MKVNTIAEQAADLYQKGLSIEAVAAELGVAYRTARKAIYSRGVAARDPSERLMGRTRPDKRVVDISAYMEESSYMEGQK